MKLKRILLAALSALAVLSCGKDETPASESVPDYVEFSFDQDEIWSGSIIYFTVKRKDLDSYSYEFIGEGDLIVQSGEFSLAWNAANIVVAETDYKGPVTLTIYGYENLENQETKKITLGLKEYTML